MGLPAVRTGDMTSHGTPLGPGPGSRTVLIGGRPAWRAGSDQHQCPQIEGVVPHVGGAVVLGSQTVLIEGRPAVRAGDTIVEAAGPPNAVVTGMPSVLIG
jgi:uncharacterized Zn-binding protein involved in type VI secretion